MKIITLTLSPALDVHCSASDFRAEHENFAQISSRDAGGKGINISRALNAFGTDNTAVVVLGDENGNSFASLLTADKINFIPISTEGAIRENITIHPQNAKETRLSFEGFKGDNSLVDKLDSLTNEICGEGDILALVGSVPSGITLSRLKKFVLDLKSRGIRIVIDSRSFTPADIAECSPFLIKPNEEEIVAYLGKEIGHISEAFDAAEAIYAKGVSNVMISLGSNGAVLACGDGIFFANAPKILPLSTIGAGDSSIAGFLAAYKDSLPCCECLKYAVAYGSAACLTEGTKPPRREDIEALLGQISVTKVK